MAQGPELPQPANPAADNSQLSAREDESALAPLSFDSGSKEYSGEVLGDPPEDSPDYQPLPYEVVAIGASAGGIEAYLQLLEQLPADTGMTFVLIPHLSREHESHLVEILGRHTPMPVSEVVDDQTPEPNHIYILPPNKWARMEGGRLKLESRPANKIPHPIDHFFQSLAADQKNRAIGVVLSGADGDGALGLAEIKGEGGISIVQEPDTARYPDMPRASIAADHIDLVLAPGLIALELSRLSRQLGKTEAVAVETGDDEQDFQRILALLRNVSGVHFRQYKPSTLRRRIVRRMLLERIDTMGAYVRYLQGNPRELRDLQEDLLINVTRFFRDPDVFDSLRLEVLPRLFEERELHQQVRIWVAGCSTGQEAYSIAICVLEFLASRSIDAPVQVFGTDASESSVAKARLGIYPETITAEVSPERLRKFFVKADKGYQIIKRVRDLCIFARQNLCVDPPFSRLDLVSCRNVLIYFGAELQNRVIPTFHYSLRPDGYLLLGASESIRGYSHMFQQIDRKHKFFLKLGAASRLSLEPTPRVPALEPAGQANHSEVWADLELQRAADRIVIARYGPPAVVINERSEILQSRGHTGEFLELPPGSASLQLLRMVRDSLTTPLREAVDRSIQLNIPVRVDHIPLTYENKPQEITIEVLPIPSVNGRPRCFLVLFVPISQSRPERMLSQGEIRRIADSHEDKGLQVVKLTQDLESTRLYLQALLDDRDAKNQELISANEEIQSANEELQSTNEELETTKEELQSANEELQTVNEELRQRNLVLTQTSNDLSNLLNSVNLPVLMLGNDLHIRHFTPPTQRLINLRPSDIGRPLGDIRMNFNVENLDKIFIEVLETLTPREIEVQDSENRWHLLRVRPYRTTDNKIDGLVVVVVDIDQLRRSQHELRDSRDFGRSIIERIPLPLAVLHLDLRIRTVNDAFRDLVDKRNEVFEGRSFIDLVSATWGMADIRPHLENLRDEDKGAARFEFEQEVNGGNKRSFRVCGYILRPDHDKALLITVEEVTAKVETERHLRTEREELARDMEAATQQLGRTQGELRALAARLMQTQEEERRRMARELHDDVSQELALLAMDGQLLADKLTEDNNEAKSGLEKLNERVAELSNSVRDMSHRLHPSAIEDLGLSQALKIVVEEFGSREEMPVTYTRRHLPSEIPLNVATNFYRIAQEALRNVSKYAGKTHLKVSLTGGDGELALEVADFGQGFDQSGGRTGLGLVSMEERARLIGGSFSVESAPGRGTRINVTAPLRAGETPS